MQCLRCQTDNSPQAKFCLGCGARLAIVCPACVAELLGGARFCSQCGTPVAAATRSPSPESYIPRHVSGRRQDRCGLAGLPAIFARAFLAWALGEFDEGLAHGHEALRLAESMDHPVSLVVACRGVATLFCVWGKAADARPLAERALAKTQAGDQPTLLPSIRALLGEVALLSGQTTEAVRLLEQALTEFAALGAGGRRVRAVEAHHRRHDVPRDGHGALARPGGAERVQLSHGAHDPHCHAAENETVSETGTPFGVAVARLAAAAPDQAAITHEGRTVRGDSRSAPLHLGDDRLGSCLMRAEERGASPWTS